MVNRGYSGTGREGSPGLAPQTEPLLLQITPQTIQEGDNTQEDQQGQKKIVSTAYLGSTTRGHGGPKENSQVGQLGIHKRPDQGP